jgi:Rieske Fe-S protein
MSRRALIANAAMVAAGMALSACGTGSDGGTAPDTLSLVLNLGDYPQLGKVGGFALVSASGSPLAVVRTADTTFVALSRICPHQGGTINTTSTGFDCSRHHARFTSNGTWTGGERTSNMRSYPVAFDQTANTLTIG